MEEFRKIENGRVFMFSVPAVVLSLCTIYCMHTNLAVVDSCLIKKLNALHSVRSFMLTPVLLPRSRRDYSACAQYAVW